MSQSYRYQEQFASTLAKAWADGKREYVRNTIRMLKNKAQAAHISACVLFSLMKKERESEAHAFMSLMHPNEK